MSGLDRPIFLVEDNPVEVDLTRRAFTRNQVANPLVVARDGEEALRVMAQWARSVPLPLVVLLDLKLPKLDGLQVLQRLKSDPHWQAVPVIVLTSSSENRDIQAAYHLGANSYIVKPVDFEIFQAVIANINQYWNTLNQSPR